MKSIQKFITLFLVVLFVAITGFKSHHSVSFAFDKTATTTATIKKHTHQEKDGAAHHDDDCSICKFHWQQMVPFVPFCWEPVVVDFGKQTFHTISQQREIVFRSYISLRAPPIV